MTETSLCSEIHRGIATWMVATIEEDRLLRLTSFQSFEVDSTMSVQETKKVIQRARWSERHQLVCELLEEFKDDTTLNTLLSAVGHDAHAHESVMREALQHIVEKAYSKYSSMHPDAWFEAYMEDALDNERRSNTKEVAA